MRIGHPLSFCYAPRHVVLYASGLVTKNRETLSTIVQYLGETEECQRTSFDICGPIRYSVQECRIGRCPNTITHLSVQETEYQCDEESLLSKNGNLYKISQVYYV